jgi:hypothetical protein
MVTSRYRVSQRNMPVPIVRNQTETWSAAIRLQMGRNTDSGGGILSRSFGYPGALVRSA